MPPIIDKISYGFETVENTLNVIGYFPGAGMLFSAALRAGLAKIQIITGLALGALFHTAALFTNHEEKKRLQKAGDIGLSYVKHGVLNIGRSLVEATLVGPLLCGAYDLTAYVGEKKLFPYQYYDTNAAPLLYRAYAQLA